MQHPAQFRLYSLSVAKELYNAAAYIRVTIRVGAQVPITFVFSKPQTTRDPFIVLLEAVARGYGPQLPHTVSLLVAAMTMEMLERGIDGLDTQICS